MIRELRIKNLALIEELELEFNKGFTVFTGETGAGKSILIGAIGLLLGERASSELIRSGNEEAEVSGIFEIGVISRPLAALLDELTIEPEEGQLIIRRKIARNDRNRIHVNGITVPLSSLKKLGDLLIDFHGQHEHQSLLNENAHLYIIDNLPGVSPFRKAYDLTYQSFTIAECALKEHLSRATMLAERKELLEFQYKELKTLDLHPGEEDELESELSLLSSSTERSACASEILHLLGTSSDSIEKKILSVRKKLDSLAKYDNSISQWQSDVDNALALFSELEAFCASYLEKTGGEADPMRIDHINSRLSRIQKLKKKHSCTLEQLIAKQHLLETDLSTIENTESDRKVLEKGLAEGLRNCIKAAESLHSARQSASEDFDKQITALMDKLGFRGGLWKTSFEPLNEPSPDGTETIRFLVRTNPGESLLPLAKTASGGEISRMMLAIKTVLAEHDHIPVLIFDEIDTGIGGVVAGEVGGALYDLSSSHQVFCISHLHQIASLADNHFKVFKEVVSDRTVTGVDKLEASEKVEEIARMLGGNSEISLQHARELLNKKKKINS